MPTQEDYFTNPYQYTLLDYTTSTPEGDVGAVGYSPRYLTDMLQRQDLVEQGKATPWEQQLQQQQVQAAQQAPMRDPRTLQYNAGEQSPATLSGGSPDLGRLMLGIRQRIQAGTATPQERQLFDTTYKNLAEQTYRSVVPQASDAFSPLGDNFMGALGVLALGASGGLAAAPLVAGGAGLATTLGSLGTLSGIAGTGAGVVGQATDQEWLQKLGMGLGAAGGIAGGIGGLANLASTGVNSLSDAARLASNAGRVVGGVGAMADNDVLKQAGGWLGTAGQLGGGVENLMNLAGGTGGSLQGVLGLAKPLQRIAGQFMQPADRSAPPGPRPVARPVSAQQSAPQRPMTRAPVMQASAPPPGAGPSGIQRLLQAASQAQQRGGPLTDQDWLRRDWRLRNPAAQSTLYNL